MAAATSWRPSRRDGALAAAKVLCGWRYNNFIVKRAGAMVRSLLGGVLALVLLPSSSSQLIEDLEDGVKLGAIPSEVQSPLSEVVRPLLEVLCPGRVIRGPYLLLGCDPAAPEPANEPWRPPHTVNGVLAGHFQSPDSEDVILSGSRREGHPFRWGGTLLMTRQQGQWKPLWYRSGIITRHCMTVNAAGRQLLVCESGYQLDGHKQHAIYTLELNADGPVQELLLATDSYDTVSERQQQRVESVRLARTGDSPVLRIRLHHERQECRKPWQECRPEDFQVAGPPPGDYDLDYHLRGSRLVLSSASEALFRRLFPALSEYLPDGLISHGEPPQ
ncbi:MAG TPA: hypothetical protein VNN17_08405 [Terriglobia bacterium]|nr:hypothetical protein [Terriglobia bacterium]